MATYNTKKVNKKDTALNKYWTTGNGNVYPIYKDAKTGKYYIVDKNGKQSWFSQQSSINQINNANKNSVVNVYTANQKSVAAQQAAQQKKQSAAAAPSVAKSATNTANALHLNAITNSKTSKNTGVMYTTLNGNIYPIYKAADGTYFIVDKNGKVSAFTKPSSIDAINQKLKGNQRSLSASELGKTKESVASEYGADGGDGGYGGGSWDASDIFDMADRYDEGLQQYVKDEADAMTTPKVWTAEELAKHYGIEDLYNMDYLTKMYTDATNKYYNDAVAKQLQYNANAELSNSLYANQLLKAYVNSYNNAAPTAIGRGAVAANALNTMLGTDMASETASSNLNSIINDYKEQQQAELANVAAKARENYEDKGKWLLSKGANINASEVQEYIKSLDAYDKAYAGIRNAQVNLANTSANAYQQAAQAGITNASYAAQNATQNLLQQMYKARYGENGAGQYAYNNVKGTMGLTSGVSGNQMY